MNHRFTRVLGERVAAQLVWPGNPVAGHQTLTALFGLLTVRPAGPLHAPLHAPRRVHRAQEEANVLGAHGLYDGVEEGHLHHRFPLTGVPEQVWGDGLIVGQALAHGDCDGLTHLPAGAHAVLEAEEGAGESTWKRVDLGRVKLTSSQVSVPNASHRKASGQGKPNLFIRDSQPDLTCSQSRLQGGLAFPDTHLGK